MARMRCRCGHEMRLTGVNSPYEFSLVPEYVIEKIAEKIGQGKMSSSAEFLGDIDREAVVVYHCTNCRRLYLEEKSLQNGEDEGYYVYERPER